MNDENDDALAFFCVSMRTFQALSDIARLKNTTVSQLIARALDDAIRSAGALADNAQHSPGEIS